jgi:lycopene beta-cyclase
MHYDFIFSGTGAAALSLLLRMVEHPAFAQHSFLLIDQDSKKKNDRTWCYWEVGDGFFESIVCRKWDHCWFHGPSFSRDFSLKPYQYKMIRGLDFYHHCNEKLANHPGVVRLQAKVLQHGQNQDAAWVDTTEGRYEGTYLFNSIPEIPKSASAKEYHLLQHFKGWMVTTEKPCFQSDRPTFMDFRVSQQHGTTFAYVLPLDDRKALVEYTLFTEQLLTPEQYDAGLRNYLAEFLQIDQYQVEEEEFGIIPMTNHRFSPGEGRCIHLGTAGGHTKASSGYTFMFIQRHADLVLQALVEGKNPIIPARAQHPRFLFYDTVLLHILKEGRLSGALVFETLFKRNQIQSVFRFLDNQSTLPADLRLIATLPTLPFARAAWVSHA